MKKHYLILAILISFVLSSCTLTKYFPSPVVTPMLSEKHEVRLNAGFPGDISIAYSPANNIGIYGGVFFTQEIRSNDDIKQIGNHFVFETAVGYYEKDPDKTMIFELYGGVGLGKFKIKESDQLTNFNFRSSVTKLFIHPSIGWKKKNFEAAVSFRLTGLSFGSPSTDYSADQISENGLKDLNRGMNLFVEPAVTLRYGLKNIKLNYQTGFSFPFLRKEIINYLPVLGSIGISINLKKEALKKTEAVQ